MHVVVLGGGAAGMTAAWELALGGVRVTLLEREPRLGGLCATHERDGWRFDLGGHRFISRSGELVARVRGLLGEELLERRRSSVILLGGRRYRYPLDASDLAQTLPPLTGLRAIGSWMRARLDARLHPGADATFEDWVTARFGRHLYDLFFGPYTEKLWGIPPARIAADWAAERISLLDLGDAILRLAGLRQAHRPRSYARNYYYPRLGIGQIFDRMGDELRTLGADVRLGAHATGLERDRKGHLRAVRFRDAEGDHTVDCDFVISTVSLPLLACWVRPSVAASAAQLRYRAVRFLNLQLDQAEVSPHTWMYVSEPRYRMTRIQEPRHRSPEMSPAGKTSLMLEIPCTVGDDTWLQSDAALRDHCLADLRTLGIEVASAVRGCFSTFVEEGYPIYSLGYADHQRALLDTIATVPNLLSLGRQGTFRYVFMDIAMEMGLEAARQILARTPHQPSFLSFRNDRQLIESQSLTA